MKNFCKIVIFLACIFSFLFLTVHIPTTAMAAKVDKKTKAVMVDPTDRF
jgi:hypothetical protein